MTQSFWQRPLGRQNLKLLTAGDFSPRRVVALHPRVPPVAVKENPGTAY